MGAGWVGDDVLDPLGEREVGGAWCGGRGRSGGERGECGEKKGGVVHCECVRMLLERAEMRW